jgi:hypothetical protein
MDAALSDSVISRYQRGGLMRTKNMVLRLDPGLAERLEAVAEVEGRSVSDVVR